MLTVGPRLLSKGGNGSCAEPVKVALASHLVKYSHHPDGRAHFSQDDKVRTVIRRQSVPLYEQQGHIFTVLIQGLRAFEAAAASKENKISAKPATVTFQIADRFPKAIRIIGRWYWIEDLNFDPRPASVGPVVRTIEADGSERNAFISPTPWIRSTLCS
jgi:hypothetical protein